MSPRRSKPTEAGKFRRWRWAGLALAALALLAGAIAAGMRFAGPVISGPAVTTLVVQGNLQHVVPAAVRAAVLPVVAGKGFFRIDMRAARSAVDALPWVANVSVRRSWPHTLYISLVEEVPVARWNDAGLLDAQGKVFLHGDVSGYQMLPLLSGPDGSAQDVLADYNAFAGLTHQRGLIIKELIVDARGAASVQLADGIKVRLGRENAQQRLERFATIALPALGPQLPNVSYVDMRYTNGFAVGWRSGNVNNPAKHQEVRPNV